MSFQSIYLRQGLLLVLALSVMGAASWWLVGSFGSSVSNAAKDLGTGVESALKTGIQEQLKLDSRFNKVDSEMVTQAMKAIQTRLEQNMQSPAPWPLEIVVVQNNDVNAVTLPGGLILVYSGLLRRTDNPEEVLGVLAHEMGHVVHGDLMKALGRNVALTALLAAGGNASPSVINDIIQTLGENAFSRQAEQQADAYALALMVKAGIRPRNLATMFKKIDPTAGKSAQTEIKNWMGSHPDTQSRITACEVADKAFIGTERSLNIDWKAVLAALH